MKTRTYLSAVIAAVMTTSVVTVNAAVELPVTSDLILWLDATDIDGDGTVEGNGEAGLSFSGGQYYVQSWVDKSGSGNNAANLPGLAPVTAIGGGSNGTNSVEFAFNGAGDRMSISGFSYGEDMTIFSVFTADTTTSGQIFNTNGSPAGGAYVLQLQGPSDLQGRVFKSPTNTGAVVGTVSPGTSYLSTYVFENNTAGGAELSINGASQGTANTINIPDTTSTAYVGNHPSASAEFNGDLSALIVYDRKLSAGEENAVGYALERQFGLNTAYHQNAININFAIGDPPNDNNGVDANESAGVDVAANGQLWNVATTNTSGGTNASFFAGNTTGGNSITLFDSHGNNNAASLTSTLAPTGGYTNFANVSGGGVGATGDAGMFQSFLNFGGSAPSETLTISGLGGDFAPGYDVYIYFEGNLDRTYGFTINGETIWGADSFDNSDINNDGIIEFAEGVGATSGTANSANYVVFRSVTGSSFTISAETLAGRAVISGLQIVAIPAPAALPAGLALIGLVAARRRRFRGR